MMTEKEAERMGMSDFDIAIGIVMGEIEPDPNKLTPMEKMHGKIISVEQTAFHDITTYEDGHEERYYIGD